MIEEVASIIEIRETTGGRMEKSAYRGGPLPVQQEKTQDYSRDQEKAFPYGIEPVEFL